MPDFLELPSSQPSNGTSSVLLRYCSTHALFFAFLLLRESDVFAAKSEEDTKTEVKLTEMSIMFDTRTVRSSNWTGIVLR